jgi:two-component system chemotaxis response regulator CheB
MDKRDIVVIGASTGGIEALRTIIRDLPPNFSASIFIVLHVAPSSLNYLDRILERAGSLPACTAHDGQPFRPGQIYVAPADHHMLIEKDGTISTSRGPKENRSRPAIDVLFRSAAAAFGPRVIGVVLTGFLDDGTAGLWAVRHRGGVTIVQNPEEAVAPGMPLSALKNVEVEHCVSLSKIAPLLVQLSQATVQSKGGKPVPRQMENEVGIAREDESLEKVAIEWGEPSCFACPECHGVLMQIKDEGPGRFRCHTGHAFSIESLLSGFQERTEEALWSAVRSLQETEMLTRHMAAHLDEHHQNDAAETLRQQADQAHKRAESVREVLFHDKPSPGSVAA